MILYNEFEPFSKLVNSEFYNDFEIFSKLVHDDENDDDDGNGNVSTNKILGSLEILAIKKYLLEFVGDFSIHVIEFSTKSLNDEFIRAYLRNYFNALVLYLHTQRHFVHKNPLIIRITFLIKRKKSLKLSSQNRSK